MELNLKTKFCYLTSTTQPTPGCNNPPDLSTTALLDTGANISLLQLEAPAQRAPTQQANKSVTQPKGTLLTTETLLLLINKLPTQARIAHRSPGISNNLLAASELADAGCELFFNNTGCEVTHNGETSSEGGGTPPLDYGEFPSPRMEATTSYLPSTALPTSMTHHHKPWPTACITRSTNAQTLSN